MSAASKRVFILGGGASLGAHQVGALRYLDEQGIRPDAIVGSSIGVVNACVYASGGVDALEAAWGSIHIGLTDFRPNLRNNPVTVIQPSEQHAGFHIGSLLSSTPARSRRLVTAGYSDAKRALTSRDRPRRGEAARGAALSEVEPAFRHEVA